jgi:putative component of toxin-antitoxin plasmid stabilization module
MNRFALEDIQEVKGQIKFKKLVIDGFCQYDEFCRQIESDGNLKKQLVGILANMNQVAQMNRLPKEKFREITPQKQQVKEFEIKKGDLRVYLIKEQGHIVILGGKKGSQNEDVKQFRSIKQRYLESKK